MKTDLPRAPSAKENWARYMYCKQRNHDDYCLRASVLEGFYLGGGEQWSDADKTTLKGQGRMPLEQNEIMGGVNSAVGYQIHNRMDIAFRPVGGKADTHTAKLRSKVAMQIAEANKLHQKETDIFEDGMIQQRGYLDLRIDYAKHVLGDLVIDVLDPMDVIPDPNGKTYDPEGWNDCIVTRWMTLDLIEQWYGMPARRKIEQFRPYEDDFGTDDMNGVDRNKFGGPETGSNQEWDAWRKDTGMVQVRVIDRQKYEYAMTDVAVYPNLDVRQINKQDTRMMAELREQGCYITRRMQRRVRRIVTTMDVDLFNDFSPFPWISVVPFFPFFRRGKTRGMVDNAMGPQEALNKLLSQYIHIINSTANSGWQVEENSLTNMTTEDLEATGASTGLVQEYRQGATPPKKIEPNSIPTGVDKMIERMTFAVRDMTVPEAMRGTNGQEISGVAIQSRQFASQQQLARPLDNLARTRHILAGRIDWFISHYYDSHRIFRITETDPKTGQEYTEELEINVMQPDGTYLNDMTAGEYDVVVTEQPMQITFENSQFQQAIELKNAGIGIPDPYVVKYSNLSDKYDIMKDMEGAQGDPVDTAKAALLDAQAAKTRSETVVKNVESMYSATQAAQNIAAMPAISPMADAMLASAGFTDANAAPAIPTAPEGLPPVAEPPMNTNPMTPQNPGVGITSGIEGGSP